MRHTNRFLYSSFELQLLFKIRIIHSENNTHASVTNLDLIFDSFMLVQHCFR